MTRTKRKKKGHKLFSVFDTVFAPAGRNWKKDAGAGV
jgi:hypothetical protein